jgi:NhaA family Na+:H+ antiporter
MMFLNVVGEVRIGSLAVEKPLFLWVNDGFMAIFFLLVGMEIKREMQEGYLADSRQLILPGAAACAGILVPALIYAAFNWQDPVASTGWAIPTATDIAFALGVLALVGKRAPVSLRILLMTLAILDDLGAIILIALFFTANLSLLSIAFSTVAIAILITLNRLRVMKLGPYLITGVILWVCVTLAGVVIAFAIPGHAAEPQMTPPLRHLITMLHPWVAFGILPLFAFVNAGVSFEGLNIAAIFAPVPLGIMLGLFVGKQLGVFAAVWAVVRLNFASLPSGVTWLHIYGVSLLCGIGFTMSIFIGSLAFAENAFGYARVDRLAVIIGSLLSGLIGYLILIIAGRRRAVSH